MSDNGTAKEPYSLHPFQRRAISQTYHAINQGARRVLFILPTGCVAGDTVINWNRGGKGYARSIAHEYRRIHGTVAGPRRISDLRTRVRAHLGDRIGLHTVVGILDQGVRQTLEIRLADGRALRATPDHKVLTDQGWVAMDDLHGGLSAIVDGIRGSKQRQRKPRYRQVQGLVNHPYAGGAGSYRSRGNHVEGVLHRVPYHRLVIEAERNNTHVEDLIMACRTGFGVADMTFLDPEAWAVHHIDGDTHNNGLANLQVISHADHARLHGDADHFGYGVLTEVRVTSVARGRLEPVYDIVCEDPHRNFVANGIVVHNCGKTITFAQMVRDCAIERRRPALVVAHREELIDQAVEKIHRQTGITGKIEKADQRADRNDSRVVVGCVPSMRGRRLEEWNRGYFGLVVADEAHHAYADSWQALLDHFGGSEEELADGSHVGAVVVGCTATPDRGDRKNLGKVFQAIAYNYPLTKAISEGYLCPIKGKVVEDFQISMSDVRVSHGDYVAKDLDALITPQLPHIAKAVLDNSLDRKRTLLFLPLVGSSQAMVRELKNLGLAADEINGETLREIRRNKLAAFRDGTITHMCNCMVLTEGFDFDAIDCVVNCRPTRSRGLFAQMVGRGTRISEGKDYLRLINFDWANAHNLVSPYELFVDEDIGDQVREEAAEGEQGGGGVQVDYMAKLMHAVRRRSDPNVLQTQLTLADYDPLDLMRLAGHEPDSELNIRWRTPAGNVVQITEEPGSSTYKQVGFLRHLGMGAADKDLSRAHASALISTVLANGGAEDEGAFGRARDALHARRLLEQEGE